MKLPYQSKAQATHHGFASVLDVFPTVLDYANIAVPQGQYKGRQINTPSGYSWKPVLDNKAQAIRPVNFSFADELHGSKYAVKGTGKLHYKVNQNSEQVHGNCITSKMIKAKRKTLLKIIRPNYKS